MEASDSEQLTHASFLSIGSNLGNKNDNLKNALFLLKNFPKISIEKVSSVYETEPQNFTDQENFLNCACKILTTLDPSELLKVCKGIENFLGRKRIFRYGPRVIDLDILLYGDLILSTDELTIPHRELRRRRFVLQPLAEIEPMLNVDSQSVNFWLNLCVDQKVMLAEDITLEI